MGMMARKRTNGSNDKEEKEREGKKRNGLGRKRTNCFSSIYAC